MIKKGIFFWEFYVKKIQIKKKFNQKKNSIKKKFVGQKKNLWVKKNNGYGYNL